MGRHDAEHVFISAVGSEHRLHDVTIRCKVVFGREWVSVKRQKFGDAGVATAVDTTDPDPVAVLLVQRPAYRLARRWSFARSLARTDRCSPLRPWCKPHGRSRVPKLERRAGCRQ
jgi:hypothetical protein